MYWLPEFLSHPYTALRSEDEPTRPSSEKPRDERLPTPKNSEEMRVLLQRLGRRRFFGLQLPREALRRDAFIDAFIGMAESSLAPFAANLNTFPANDFRLATLVSNERADYRADARYGELGGARQRGSALTEPLSREEVFIDAPFAYALLYQGAVNADWKIISMIAFAPDFKAGILRVDQLQGGTMLLDKREILGNKNLTDPERAEGLRRIERASKIRLKFAGSPEHALFAVAADLANRVGLEAIGLRKPKRNKYIEVSSGIIDDDGIARQTKIYGRIAKDASLSNVRGSYFTRRLKDEMPAYL